MRLGLCPASGQQESFFLFRLIENRVVVAGGGEAGGQNWELGISRCKLLHKEWINHKVLLYSTGNHIH